MVNLTQAQIVQTRGGGGFPLGHRRSLNTEREPLVSGRELGRDQDATRQLSEEAKHPGSWWEKIKEEFGNEVMNTCPSAPPFTVNVALASLTSSALTTHELHDR